MVGRSGENSGRSACRELRGYQERCWRGLQIHLSLRQHLRLVGGCVHVLLKLLMLVRLVLVHLLLVLNQLLRVLLLRPDVLVRLVLVLVLVWVLVLLMNRLHRKDGDLLRVQVSEIGHPPSSARSLRCGRRRRE